MATIVDRVRSIRALHASFNDGENGHSGVEMAPGGGTGSTAGCGSAIEDPGL
jgi:hypothetical protein